MTGALAIFRISAAMRGNRIIYWLGRIPLIRRAVSDELYRAAEGKLALTCVLCLWRAVKALAGKFLYLGVLFLLPLYFLLGSTWEGLASRGFGPFCFMLLPMSYFAGVLVQPKAVEPSQLKFTCVRMMAMDARRYQLLAGLGHHLAMFVTFTPALMTAAVLLGQGAWTGALLSVELAAARLIGEWLHVLLYDKTGKTLGANVLYIVFMCMGAVYAAYIPAIILLSLGRWAALAPQGVLLSPVFAGVLLLLGAVCAAALIRYPNYYRLALDTSRPEQISRELARKKAGNAQFRDVELRESDLTAGADSALTGWPYLQSLFFRRHRRLLYKPVKIVLVILGCVTAVGAAVLLFFRGEETARVFSAVPMALPYCVFFLYLMDNSVGTRITKAMFYNCDVALLRYGWYRGSQAVLRNFSLRFVQLCAVNLALSAGVCVMFTVLTLCAGGRPAIGGYLAFLAALLCRPQPGHVLPAPALHLRPPDEKPLLRHRQLHRLRPLLRLQPDPQHPLLVRPAGAGGDGGLLRRHPAAGVPARAQNLPGEVSAAPPCPLRRLPSRRRPRAAFLSGRGASPPPGQRCGCHAPSFPLRRPALSRLAFLR